VQCLLIGCQRSCLDRFILASHNKASWCTSFKAMLESLGIVFSENLQPIDGALVCNLRKLFIENFKTTLRQATETSSLKLETYNLMRSENFALQPCLRAKNGHEKTDGTIYDWIPLAGNPARKISRN